MNRHDFDRELRLVSAVIQQAVVDYYDDEPQRELEEDKKYRERLRNTQSAKRFLHDGQAAALVAAFGVCPEYFQAEINYQLGQGAGVWSWWNQ